MPASLLWTFLRTGNEMPTIALQSFAMEKKP
jgi:hypothetical protein